MIRSPVPPKTASEKVLARARRLIKSDILPGKPDREGVRALARVCFPESDIAEPRYLEWQYDQNPSGQAYELNTKDPTRITGHCAIIPLRYKIGAEVRMGSAAVNVMTHPDVRGRGIFIILHKEVFDLCQQGGNSFTFGFSNEFSHKNCLRHLGYQELGRFPLWILPFNLSLIVKMRRPPQSRLMRAAAWSANPFWHIYRAISSVRRRARSLAVERVDAFTEEFDRFWQNVEAGYTNILIRDRDYLDWRFIRHPTRKYTVFVARSARPDKTIRGYLVARMTEVEGVPCGMIVDILAAPTPEGNKAAAAMIAAFNAHARAQGAALGLCLMLRQHPVVQALRRNGYFICPKPFRPREFPILLHWNSPGPAPADLFDLNKWYLTMGDYDAV